MIKNYFKDVNGHSQSDEAKREKAVSAVLEIIQAAANQTGSQVSLNLIQSKLNDAADAVQAALEKK